MSIPVFNPLNSDWLTFPLVLAGIFAVIGLAEILLNKFQWSGENSRRVVHVMVGVLICGTLFLFESKYPVMALSLTFIGVNLATLLSKQFKGMHATNRVSFGTVYYPVSILVLTYFFWNANPVVYLVSILILAIGDPIASLVGESVDKPQSFTVWKDSKSLQGSAALAVVIFLLTYAGIHFGGSQGLLPVDLDSVILIALVTAIIGTASESISHAGSDNLSLPLLSAAILDVLIRLSDSGRLNLLLWLCITLLVVTASYRLKILKLSGAVAAFILGSFVFGIGGLPWMIPMAVFFGLSSLLSKLGRNRKASLETVYEKSGNRDMMQVLANAGLALPLVLFWFYTGDQLFYLAYLAGLGAATADTWATELGAFSPGQPRNILNMKPVTKGTSGGVSIFGTFSALLGSAALAASGWLSAGLWRNESILPSVMMGIIAAGFIASLLDSILGASVQAHYQCGQCGNITEKRVHCDARSEKLYRGVPWINNDLVNFFCTLFSVILLLLYHWSII